VATSSPNWFRTCASRNEIVEPGFRTTAVQVKRSPNLAGRRNDTFISVLATNTLRSFTIVTAEAPMAESTMAERKPPCIMPAGFKNRSSTFICQTVVPGTDLSEQTKPRVKSQFGGI